MIQRGQHAGFTLESGQTVRITRERLRQDFQRYVAAEFRIGRLIYVTHTARSEVICDLVLRELGSNQVLFSVHAARILSNAAGGSKGHSSDTTLKATLATEAPS
jgi:hypothetical protein